GEALPNLVIALIRVWAELYRAIRFGVSGLIDDENRHRYRQLALMGMPSGDSIVDRLHRLSEQQGCQHAGVLDAYAADAHYSGGGLEQRFGRSIVQVNIVAVAHLEFQSAERAIRPCFLLDRAVAAKPHVMAGQIAGILRQFRQYFLLRD